jgi:hypothetical protein
VARLIVVALSEDSMAAPGNRLRNYIEVSVTDASGDPVTGLGASNFRIEAMVVGPGGGHVSVESMHPIRLPGFYHINVVPIGDETWKAGVYIFAIAVEWGADRGQTLAKVLID